MISTFLELVIIFKNGQISGKIQVLGFSLKNIIMATLLELNHGCPVARTHSLQFLPLPMVFLLLRSGALLTFLVALTLLFFLKNGPYCFIHVYYLLYRCSHLCLHHYQNWYIHFLCLVFGCSFMLNLSVSFNLNITEGKECSSVIHAF